eukprot:SAG31_NODE_1274_length_9050_cov_10.910178_1_plen_33_part_10
MGAPLASTMYSRVPGRNPSYPTDVVDGSWCPPP